MLVTAFMVTLLTGCGGVANPSNNVVETFSGTVTPTSQPVSHSFSANRNGEMSVRFTAITPNNASLIGVLVGQVFSGLCQPFNRMDGAGLNRDVLVSPINRGSYCIQVFNGGGVAAAQNYTLQVSHP